MQEELEKLEREMYQALVFWEAGRSDKLMQCIVDNTLSKIEEIYLLENISRCEHNNAFCYACIEQRLRDENDTSE